MKKIAMIVGVMALVLVTTSMAANDSAQVNLPTYASASSSDSIGRNTEFGGVVCVIDEDGKKVYMVNGIILKDVTPKPLTQWERTWRGAVNWFLGLFYPGPMPSIPKGC